MSRGYLVYRIDQAAGAMEPVGCLIDRRGISTREYRLPQLIREARRLFEIAESEFIRIDLVHPVGERNPGESTIARGVLSIRTHKMRGTLNPAVND